MDWLQRQFQFLSLSVFPFSELVLPPFLLAQHNRRVGCSNKSTENDHSLCGCSFPKISAAAKSHALCGAVAKQLTEWPWGPLLGRHSPTELKGISF
jgi:hypothetical protein